MSKGRFIVIEGLDGAGTTTQSKRLTQWLQSLGHAVHQTAEPSDGPIGTKIRRVLRGEEFAANGDVMHPDAVAALFVADRVDHLSSEINPALDMGKFVVCDRYVHSSLAYQGVDCDIDWVSAMNAPMQIPDITLLVVVDPQVAAQRRAARNGKPELYEEDSFQTQVAEGYRKALQLRPQDQVVTIDGAGSVEAVHRAICEAVSRCLFSMDDAEGN